MHGDGSPTRRYLYAGDAADAFDTILHKGQIGQIYNVGSLDEVSNIDLCAKLLSVMGMVDGADASDPATIMQKPAFRTWVKYTHDRPFNDCRYAVDGSKLRRLGWDQQTNLDEGLRITVDWYRRFGEVWWGDISHVLTPFPVVEEGSIVPDFAHRIRDDPMRPGEESRPDTPKGNGLANEVHGSNA